MAGLPRSHSIGSVAMIRPMEKYDLKKILKAIEEDKNHQHPDENQHKDIPQEAITELMIDNLKRKKRRHD